MNEFVVEGGEPVDLERLTLQSEDQNLLKSTRESVVLPCYDFFIEHDEQILHFEGYHPVENSLSPLGDIIERGVPVEDSIRKKVKDVTNLDLVSLIPLGVSRVFSEFDTQRAGKGTDTLKVSYAVKTTGDLAVQSNHDYSRVNPDNILHYKMDKHESTYDSLEMAVRQVLQPHGSLAIQFEEYDAQNSSSVLISSSQLDSIDESVFKSMIAQIAEPANSYFDSFREYVFENGDSFYLTSLEAENVSETGDIEGKLYQKIHQNAVIVCHDVFVEYGGSIFVVQRDNYPAKDQIWVPGGRAKRGILTIESLKEKTEEETGLQLEGPRFLGIARTYFQTDPFNHGRGTDTINLVYFAKGAGDVGLDKLHSNPFYITPQNYDSKKASLHPYLIPFMDKAIQLVGK